jgi:hypothetical protein
MSAEPMIRELFRGLETTIHERLSLVEQILTTIEKPKIPLYDNEFVKRIERLEQQRQQPDNTQYLEARIAALEEQLISACAELAELKLRSTAGPIEVQSSFPSPIAHVSKLEEQEPDDELVLDEEEEEEAPEEEEQALELEEFEYKGTTYYKDADNNVYSTDEDGDVIPDPIARWNGTKLVRIVS